MRHATVAAVLLATFAAGCAATGKHLDTSKPIQIEGGPYRQNDEPLLMDDLEEKLAAHPAASSHLSGYKVNKWTGSILATVGGGLVGWNLGDNLTKKGDKTWTPALVGAGAIVLAIPFALIADGQMRSAAEAYNASFTQAKSETQTRTVPYFVVLPGSEGGTQYVGGMTMFF
jgi:hypothetical protein